MLNPQRDRGAEGRMMRALAAMLMAGLVVGTIGCDDGANTAPPTEMDMLTVDPDMGDPEPEPDMGDPEPEPDMMVEMDMAPEGDLGPDAEPPPMAEACDPCEEDADCAEGAACLFIGEAAVCSVPCDEGDCPDGYTCVAWEDAGEQCVPEPGVCLGCDAPGEAFDGCDGFDNDCDEIIDEDFEPDVCGEGACAGTSACVDGVLETCEPGMPGPDDSACDGVDEDCDGNIDEDYVEETCGDGLCQATSACADGAVLMCMPDVDAALPRDITCDAVDDDCDGGADEDYVGESCGVGACAAVGTCEDGEASCTPGAPLAETDVTCNGVDDDCDGSADEEYASDEFCGLGLCRTAGSCADGEVACVPRAPEFDIDQICDGQDENCDGQIDENCVVNSLALTPISFDDEFVIVDVAFAQEGALDENNARFFQPRLIDLYVNLPAGVDVQASLRATVAPGQAAIDAEKQVRGSVLPEDERILRIQVLAINNDNRIAPGVIARLTLVNTGAPPWAFSFVEELSSFAPAEAGERLEFAEGVVE